MKYNFPRLSKTMVLPEKFWKDIPERKFKIFLHDPTENLNLPEVVNFDGLATDTYLGSFFIITYYFFQFGAK